MSVDAHLDFEIVIPSFIYFQIGSAGGQIDTMTFDVEAAGIEPGDGTSVPGSIDTNPLLDTVDVIVRTNAANFSIQASGGNLTSGTTSDTIPLTDITVLGGGGVPVPAFGGAPAGLATLGIRTHTDTWQFSYDNVAVVDAATYTASVTYTATDI